MLIVVHFAIWSLTSIKWGNNILYQKGSAQYLLGPGAHMRSATAMAHAKVSVRHKLDIAISSFSAKRRVQINRLCFYIRGAAGGAHMQSSQCHTSSYLRR